MLGVSGRRSVSGSVLQRWEADNQSGFDTNGATHVQDVARLTTSSRPFTSPVHVLILPSLLPVDLRAALPYLDESSLASDVFKCRRPALTSTFISRTTALRHTI